MRTTIRLAMAVLLTGPAALGAAPASAVASAAVTAKQQCPDSSVCFWEGPGFQGRRTVRQYPGPPNVCRNVPDRPAQSAVNNTRYERSFYAEPGCTEDSQVADVEPGEERAEFSAAARSWR